MLLLLMKKKIKKSHNKIIIDSLAEHDVGGSGFFLVTTSKMQAQEVESKTELNFINLAFTEQITIMIL